MNEITQPQQLHNFFQVLGEHCESEAEIYLFGGSAILLMGSARQTGDVDFTLKASNASAMRTLIGEVASAQGLDLEESMPEEFMPLPIGLEMRHQFVQQYGLLRVYIFDPYSIALMKIDRAFQSDMQDVRFLLQQGLINLKELEQHLNEVAQRYEEPIRLRQNFETLKRGL